jgi:hypothetical protein
MAYLLADITGRVIGGAASAEGDFSEEEDLVEAAAADGLGVEDHSVAVVRVEAGELIGNERYNTRVECLS